MNNLETIMKESFNLRLLFVEDEMVARESIQMILEEFFGTVIVAVDGEDGLEKLKNNQIDLIITDISMPQLNGLKMIEQIRKTDKDIFIMVLSAHRESEYFLSSIELGIDGYLLKPFDMEQFLSVLSNIIKNMQLKKEIRKVCERIELALEGSKTSILDWIFTTNDFYISPNWKDMLGFSEDELPNNTSTWRERVHHDDKKKVFTLLQETKTKKIKYFEVNHRLKHKDGHWVWVFVRAQIFYDENGKRVRMVGTYTDITEEKGL